MKSDLSENDYLKANRQSEVRIYEGLSPPPDTQKKGDPPIHWEVKSKAPGATIAEESSSCAPTALGGADVECSETGAAACAAFDDDIAEPRSLSSV